jgi:4'-phosphopantetheinyl transferase EntD
VTESLLASVVDAPVAVQEIRGTEADDSLLWPDEAALITSVAAKRRRDFTLGRRCARKALEQLGVDPVPILRGGDREPLWPTGVVGSITHTDGYAAAVAARASQVRGVGIDAEQNGPLPAGVGQRIARPEELDQLATWQAVDETVHVDRLIFSAKEAIYKVWFPLAGRWLGYLDARLDIDPANRTFSAEILVDGPVRLLDGRFANDDRFLVAAIQFGG